ncbi:MAG: hypothetical protein WCE44_02685 [Candidatus Velthaea sp.]
MADDNPYGKPARGETAAQAAKRRAKFYTYQREDAERRADQGDQGAARTASSIYGKLQQADLRGNTGRLPMEDATKATGYGLQGAIPGQAGVIARRTSDIAGNPMNAIPGANIGTLISALGPVVQRFAQAVRLARAAREGQALGRPGSQIVPRGPSAPAPGRVVSSSVERPALTGARTALRSGKPPAGSISRSALSRAGRSESEALPGRRTPALRGKPEQRALTGSKSAARPSARKASSSTAKPAARKAPTASKQAENQAAKSTAKRASAPKPSAPKPAAKRASAPKPSIPKPAAKKASAERFADVKGRVGNNVYGNVISRRGTNSYGRSFKIKASPKKAKT